MIQTLAGRIIEYMEKLGVLNEPIEVHKYGIETILSTTISLIWIFSLSCVFDKVTDGFIYIIGFYIIRKFCGGYHCNNYFSCISLYVILFVTYLLTYSLYEKIKIFIFITSIIVFLLFVPIHNRALNLKEHNRYRKISFVFLMLYICLSYTSIYSSMFIYLILVVTILIVVSIKKYEIKTV